MQIVMYLDNNFFFFLYTIDERLSGTAIQRDLSSTAKDSC